MKVKVEQRHIDAGFRGAPFGCPIALAIREDIAIYQVSVTIAKVVVNYPKYVVVWYTPESIQNFIAEFDTGLQVYPTEFELKYIEVYHKQ